MTVAKSGRTAGVLQASTVHQSSVERCKEQDAETIAQLINTP